jgi:hypothetical protein
MSSASVAATAGRQNKQVYMGILCGSAAGDGNKKRSAVSSECAQLEDKHDDHMSIWVHDVCMVHVCMYAVCIHIDLQRETEEKARQCMHVCCMHTYDHMIRLLLEGA